MSSFKFLIDTNIVIGLEDAQPVEDVLSTLARLCGQNSCGIFVEQANFEDISRDLNAERRNVTLSKLARYPRLKPLPVTDADLERRYGPLKSVNDRCDARLLAALDVNAVDFLVTRDDGLRKRAERAGLSDRVFTVEEAVEWLSLTFYEAAVSLPFVVERNAYELDVRDPIFDSLRADYPGFDAWFDKCCREHRPCWVLEVDDQIAGLIIRKDEVPGDATRHRGPRILKICTFKVRDEFRGERFGELLLKQALWFAQRNAYDLLYLTAFPKHTALIELLRFFGFEETLQATGGEITLEKIMLQGPIPENIDDPLLFDRLHYPRAYDGESVRKFYVPIQPDYHRRLFPEIALASRTLPLFPDDNLFVTAGDRTPGNTIRKVYLSHSRITQIRPGDLLFFYMSKGLDYANSQSVTTVGVVESVGEVESAEDLIRLTAKRSVFSAAELTAMSTKPVKLINFLLVSHLDPPIPLSALIDEGVFARPPQSFAQWSEAQYLSVKGKVQL